MKSRRKALSVLMNAGLSLAVPEMRPTQDMHSPGGHILPSAVQEYASRTDPAARRAFSIKGGPPISEFREGQPRIQNLYSAPHQVN